MFPTIQQALEQVQELRTRILVNRLFRGYSARARLGGAFAALAGTAILASGALPQTVHMHTTVWGTVCVIAAALNYGALIRWFFEQPESKREFGLLRPAIDALPPFIVAAALTWAIYAYGAHDLLFGSWMMMFGLMHTSSWHSLPQKIWWLGWYYIACGLWYFTVLDAPSFFNPWPMGIVFAVGECAGAWVLRKHRVNGELLEG